MFRCFFILSFVVVVCSTLCVAVYARSIGVGTQKLSKELFALGKEIDNVKEPSGSKSYGSITLKEIKPPFLLFAAKGNVMVAVAEARHVKNNAGEEKVNVVARFVEAKDTTDWGADVITHMNEKWKTQLATENNGGEKTFSTIMASAVNANGEKIYVLLLGNADSGNSEEWKFKSVTGDVSTTENKDTLITWNANQLTVLERDTKMKKLNDKFFLPNTDDRFLFLTKDNKIVFVVRGMSSERSGDDRNPKTATVFFFFNKTNADQSKLLRFESFVGWYSFFQWKEEIFKAPTNHANGDNNEVIMFNASENNFTRSNNSIVCLRDFLKDKKNFVTADIQGINVLLLTQRKQQREISDAHLWITDGSRVGYAGTIITGFTGIFYGSVLYTNNELFALHKKYETGGSSDNFIFSRLNEQLENIKKVLNVWNESKNKIEELCQSTKPRVIPCSTDGLVGFLSDTEINDGWTDMYNYTNATVTQNTDENREKVKKVNSGFTFSGDGVGAKWEVGKEQNEDQLYNFTDPGFTLVATVAIESSAKENEFNSVLGVGVEELLPASATKNIGLLCSKNDKFVINDKTNTPLITTDADCVLGKTYSIALVLKNENLEIYVDGKQISLDGKKVININKKDNIEHFYFGANRGTTPLEKTAVTITNVLLYNRPFTKEEIKQFQPQQNNETGVQTISKNNTGSSPESGKKKIETDISSNTSTTENKHENKSLTTEDSAARVGVVGVLCFMLFGVFTLLGRYVY